MLLHLTFAGMEALNGHLALVGLDTLDWHRYITICIHATMSCSSNDSEPWHKTTPVPVMQMELKYGFKTMHVNEQAGTKQA